MEITEQERQSLIEMTIALSEFMSHHEFGDVVRVYHALIERLKDEGNDADVARQVYSGTQEKRINQCGICKALWIQQDNYQPVSKRS